MWFKLASATFTNHLGSMDSLSNTWSIQYQLSGGLSRGTSPTSVTKGSSASITLTLSSGATYNNDLSVTVGGTAVSVTPSISGSTISFTLSAVSGAVVIKASATGGSIDGGGNEGGTTIPEGYTLLPTTKKALGVTSSGTGRVSSNNAKRFSTADDTVANGILIPNGNTLHLVGLASGTYPLRLDYIYCTGNVTCPPAGSTTAIEGLVGTASNYVSTNYFPLNKDGADTIDITNNYGEDYWFWFGFAGLTLNEGILAEYDTYTLAYKID